MEEEEIRNKEFNGVLIMIIKDLERIIRECDSKDKTLNDLIELKKTLEGIVG